MIELIPFVLVRKCCRHRTEGCACSCKFRQHLSPDGKGKGLGGKQGLAFMHRRQRLHQSLGPASVLLNRTDEMEVARMSARLRDLAFAVDISDEALIGGATLADIWEKRSTSSSPNPRSLPAALTAPSSPTAGLIPFCLCAGGPRQPFHKLAGVVLNYAHVSNSLLLSSAILLLELKEKVRGNYFLKGEGGPGDLQHLTVTTHLLSAKRSDVEKKTGVDGLFLKKDKCSDFCRRQNPLIWGFADCTSACV